MTIIAKASMAVFMLGPSVVAFLTYDFPRLQLLAQMSYQGIVQLAVPLFLACSGAAATASAPCCRWAAASRWRRC